MKLSKHVHSCLLVEEAGKRFLFDPGNYTFEENGLDVDAIPSLDYLLITHEHQDHMYLPLIKKVVTKFPDVKIFSNKSVLDILGKKGIKASSKGDDLVSLEEISHERIFSGPVPQNVMITINSKLTHPGDSHHLQTPAPILALPVQASWGSTTDAVELAVRLKPKVIIPIHDWHWNEQARSLMYKRLEDYFANIGIKFIGLTTGQEIEI
ncbi:MAG: beta-lactamase [Microgenomates group bacterium Gr01-1014_7]|nr:MAG: beta-lactamase [Microgenomates group bacterium Gr01-1014_7]